MSADRKACAAGPSVHLLARAVDVQIVEIDDIPNVDPTPEVLVRSRVIALENGEALPAPLTSVKGRSSVMVDVPLFQAQML